MQTSAFQNSNSVKLREITKNLNTITDICHKYVTKNPGLNDTFKI